MQKSSVGEQKVVVRKRGNRKSSKSILREDCFKVLSEENVADPALEPKLDKKKLLMMYQNMVLTRELDERGMKLQRQGRIGFYVPSFGQEAIQTGSAAALSQDDWIFPSYREPGLFLYRGAPVEKMIANLFGNSGDVCKGRQMPNHYSFADLKLFSVSSPISTQVIQAVGAAYASKIKGEKDVAITYFGDGGSSENDAHTGMTFAAVYKAPTIFICTNNQLAISCPRTKQCAAERFADKAIGYGMPGVAVDGNDVLAVYHAVSEAVARARKGEGPTLIEAVTYRMGPHSSSDDPTRYRDEAEYEAWKKRDPILKFKQYLISKKFWDEEQDKKLVETYRKELLEVIDQVEKLPPPSLDDLFTDVYAELTPQLERQKQELLTEAKARGEFKNNSEAFPL